MPLDADRIALFDLDAAPAATGFGGKVAECLGIALAEHEQRDFEDGEHKQRPLISVRGRDVFVLECLYGDARRTVNDKLCRLLFFLGALRDADARRITAVVPYLAYARKDRRTKPRDPVTTRYIAALFEAVGIDHILTLDAHNLAAYQNAFRCRADHLEARNLFADHFAALLGDREVIVVSPDAGGVKRAERFRHALQRRLGRPIGSAFLEKYRSEGVVSGEAVIGEVRGRAAIIIDDLVSTGGTLARAAAACRRQGARSVHAAATHGLFVGDAGRALADPALDGLAITNTIPPFRLDPALVEAKLTVLDAAPLFARAIRAIHTGGSIVDLLED